MNDFWIWIIYLLGAPIFWRSKGQKGVTLSGNKSESVAMSEADNEIRFIHYFKGMGVDVKFPIVFRCYSVGTTFMAENSRSGVRTRHIDNRYHFVCEHVKNGLMKFFSLINHQLF
jgi:hypothetical protein